jgi:hypothetical protein
MTDDFGTIGEDEFYDDATDEFPSINDLCPGANNTIKSQVDGRLVAIWAQKNGVQKKDDGSTYPYTEGLVLVLDDGKDGGQVTDLIGAAPQEVPLRFSTGGTQSRLSPRIEGMTKVRKDAEGNIIAPSVPMRWRPMIGRINAKPSQKVKNGSPAIGISAPEDEDRATINRYRNEIVDLGRSGWTNPEGFQPAPRSSAPAPVIEVCGATGPEGWTCDWKPRHHPADEHWAETGEAPGLRWRETTVDVSTFGDAEPALVPGRPEVVPATDILDQAQAIAEAALDSERPAHWAIALQRIMELDRG